MAVVPERKDERFRQMQSAVYALAMVFGSLYMSSRLTSDSAAFLLRIPKILCFLNLGVSGRFREGWCERHFGGVLESILCRCCKMVCRKRKNHALYECFSAYVREITDDDRAITLCGT
jgi:hypothetical protein